MEITVLGSGAWEGIPAPFCRCSVCNLAAKNPISKNNRTRPQLLVENDEGGFFLEVSPDIRTQVTKHSIPPITNFIVSHWHFDHMYGLHELFSWSKRLPEKPTIHCSPGTQEVLEKEFSYLPIITKTIKPFEPFSLFGIIITPIPVYHMRLREEGVAENSLQNSYAYLLEDRNSRVAYLGDYYRIPAPSIEKIRNLDIVIADGTYLLTEEYKGTKLNHLHGKDIIQFTKSLGAKKIYYHSISHLTGKTHEKLQSSLPEGHIATFDGMRLDKKPRIKLR